MAITPMEIHNKEFSRTFRGYDEDEVDQFLDEIIEEFEKLYKENLDLKDKVNMLADQISYYKAMENTLKETLVTAQKTAKDVAANAEKKAEIIIKEAESKSKSIINEANRQVLEIQQEHEEFKKQAQVFKSRFRSLLETQLEMINDIGGDAAEDVDYSAETDEADDQTA